MNSKEKNAVSIINKMVNQPHITGLPNILEEHLVSANLDDLKLAMEQDKALASFLNTPAKDLPEHYKYLVQEISNDVENETLYNLILMSLRARRVIPYFSKSGSKITGFAAYQVANNEVTEIKIFTFNPKQGTGVVLIRDLITLLDELVEKYDKVSWAAMKDNPANKIYKKAVEKYSGHIDEDGELIHYTIIPTK